MGGNASRWVSVMGSVRSDKGSNSGALAETSICAVFEPN